MTGADRPRVPEALAASLPSPERRRQGPYPVFECFQRIPCNPCATVCDQGVIEEFADLNDLPRANYDAACTACARCVAVCPGLSCFLIDETYSDTEATVTLAYEYLPLPEDGETVEALDREGNPAGPARVVRVRHRKRPERTPLVTLAVPVGRVHVVRGFRRREGEGGSHG
ncbi:MAG: 4Fe-4S dicluster domain-containing protein [Deferrisomatales bacterium]